VGRPLCGGIWAGYRVRKKSIGYASPLLGTQKWYRVPGRYATAVATPSDRSDSGPVHRFTRHAGPLHGTQAPCRRRSRYLGAGYRVRRKSIGYASRYRVRKKSSRSATPGHPIPTASVDDDEPSEASTPCSPCKAAGGVFGSAEVVCMGASNFLKFPI
jgi:hypothetical protein